MKRSPQTHFKFLAATTAADAMSSRSSAYRGGRGRGQRSYSERPYNEGRGQFVSGDSHFGTVREANLGFRRGNGSGNRESFTNQAPPPPFNQNQQYRQVPPPPFYQNQEYRQVPPPPVYQNQHSFRQQQQRRPPSFNQNQPARPQPPKQRPRDYRNWECAKTTPPPDGERFVVLSYNILADYLAIGHRSKLYFHIPRYMLEWGWRKESILFELKLWSADIMCFQEVDKFEELEQELKNRGYTGLWKMRTGSRVDGCAIYWRMSRFKLLYEESIEFNKLGLRDNVAQICVLELLSQNNAERTAPATSAECSNKIVICNIHVLYNPKRGEIKLGQVRNLLDRAYSISKTWNNAPVVLCGDFNCTPKSPLYSFISEQKLSLSGLDRDKVSGQASAEIHAPKLLNANPRFQPADRSIPDPSLVDSRAVGREVGVNLNNSLSDMQGQNNPDGNLDNHVLVNSYPQLQCTTTVLGVCGNSCTGMECGIEENAHSDEVARENRSVPVGNLESSKESSSACTNEYVLPVDQVNVEIREPTSTVTSHREDICLDISQIEYREKQNATFHSNEVSSLCEPSVVHFYNENEGSNLDKSSLFHEAPLPGDSGYPPQSIAGDEKGRSSTAHEVNISVASSSIDLDKKLENLSLDEVNGTKAEEGNVVEDDTTFVFALHDNFGKDIRLDSDPTAKEFLLGNEVLDDFSPARNSNTVDLETTYDPSSWTPMEIATATGNADCKFLEHPLKLKSTYTEVEDCSGTRDSSGEPLVTSYNRCFMGTVDYIWRSEGLQTVRALAPIPKDAMQWTPGFPTKKWGSDHVALVSELAFTKDLHNQNTEVQ